MIVIHDVNGFSGAAPRLVTASLAERLAIMPAVVVTGALEPAKGDVDELPPPLLVPSDVEKPSSVLARLREPER